MKFGSHIILLGLITSGIGLTGCSLVGHKQTEPLAVNPIVIPPGVPPIEMDDYYQTAPESISTQPKAVSILPPGSAISKKELNGK